MEQNKGIKLGAFVISLIFLTTIVASAMQPPLFADGDMFHSAHRQPFMEIYNKLIRPLSDHTTKTLADENNYSNVGFCIRQTADGGYVVVGSSFYDDWEMGSTSAYVLMMKIDAEGKKQWNKLFPGLGLAMGYSFVETNDSGFVITGMTADNEFDTTSILLLKTDGEGNQIWQKTITVGDSSLGYYLQKSSDGGYIITGSTYNYFYDQSSILLVKTDANGIMQWNQTYNLNDSGVGLFVQQTNDGGYVLAGHDASSLLLDDFGSNSIVIKTNSTGIQEWNKTIEIGNETYLYSLAVTSDDRYLGTGYTASYNDSNSSVFTLLVKIDNDGNEVWNKTVGPENSMGTSVQRTNDNGFICTGIHYDDFSVDDFADVLLVKVDQNGNEQWNKTYDIDMYDIAYFVQQTSDNGYVITGYTFIMPDIFDDYLNIDVIVIKTDGNGSLQWKNTYEWTIPSPSPDTTPPRIVLIKPAAGMIYRWNETVRSSLRTIIFGGIMIEVNATDNQSGINRIEFYIDGVLKGNDTSASYTYNWDQEKMRIMFSKHKHTIKVIAYDNEGNSATDQMEVLRFF